MRDSEKTQDVANDLLKANRNRKIQQDVQKAVQEQAETMRRLNSIPQMSWEDLWALCQDKNFQEACFEVVWNVINRMAELFSQQSSKQVENSIYLNILPPFEFEEGADTRQFYLSLCALGKKPSYHKITWGVIQQREYDVKEKGEKSLIFSEETNVFMRFYPRLLYGFDAEKALRWLLVYRSKFPQIVAKKWWNVLPHYRAVRNNEYELADECFRLLPLTKGQELCLMVQLADEIASRYKHESIPRFM